MKLGPYEILGELGRGGMGVVHRALDSRTGIEVALKVLAEHLEEGTEGTQRFRQEAQAASRVRHPGVVAVLDSGEADGQHYLAMELVRGESLADLLQRHPEGLPLRQVLTLAEAIARALAAAHSCGVIHRDLKPANILIDEQGRPRLTDFGIARVVARTTMTRTGMVMGTPSYMSPEQAAGKRVTEQSDLYSLGIMIFEMLTGDVPFHGENALAVIFQHIERPAPAVTSTRIDVPAPVARIVARCLEKEPTRRFESAEALAFNLKVVAEDLTPVPPLVRTLRLVHRVQPRTWRRVAAACLVGGGFAWGLVVGERATRPPELPAPTVAASPAASSPASSPADRPHTGLFSNIFRSPDPESPPEGADPPSSRTRSGEGSSGRSGLGKPASGSSGSRPAALRSPRGVATRAPGAVAVVPVTSRAVPVSSPSRLPTSRRSRSVAGTTRAAPSFSQAPLPEPPPSAPSRLETQVTHPRDGARMVLVPAGAFTMGADSGAPAEGPAHRVDLPAYYIDRTEVTVEQYRRFVEATGYVPQGGSWDMFGAPLGQAAPAVNLTWNDAAAYAEWAGKRLPSEEEWEKAARGNSRSDYAWGGSWRDSFANWGDFDPRTRTMGGKDRFEKASPVGALSSDRSFCGALDMGGNVMEWTADWYQAYPGSRASDPYFGRNLRVTRGGSWEDSQPGDLRVTRRRGLRPHQTSAAVGFRTVADPGSL